MSWTDVFPVITDSQLDYYDAHVTSSEADLLDEWCGVARTINCQSSQHLVVSSLFWKNARVNDGDLPLLTRDIMINAAKLGFVTRFSPWEHYVVPLIEGARSLKEARPEIVFRVYLAADLEFLVEDLVAVGCEIKLMRGSSLRHNPGAMWRFLALEEPQRWITITDSDRARHVIDDVIRTEQTMEAGLGLWRVPYIFESEGNGDNPGRYRPIIACQFGARGGLGIERLMKGFLWYTMRDEMPDRCRLRTKNGTPREVPIYGTLWPTYGFDEWFLLGAVYPRLAFEGVLTFMGWRSTQVSHFFALDIEYVTWANPKSEIFYYGESEPVRPRQHPPLPLAKSPILERLLREEEV
jgi:hypothetical protein